jgi:hypothetical protein
MSLDAQAMVEVNRPLIFEAARAARQEGASVPLVLSVATFGRGIRQEVLQELEQHRRAYGHNQSLVSTPPAQCVARLLKQPDWQPGEGQGEGFWALGYAFGKSSVQWWNWDEESVDPLF